MLFQKALSAALDVKVDVAVGTIVYTSSGTSASLAYPAGIQAGDLLFASGLIQSASAAGTITGWDNLASAGSFSTISYKTATGSESGSVTVNFGATAGAVHIMFRVRMTRNSAPVTPMYATGSGIFATNPSLTLSVPASYSYVINLVNYYDNGSINMTGLNADLTQLAYRTTSFGLYAGWINSSAVGKVGATITSNSNGNTLTAREFPIYI